MAVAASRGESSLTQALLCRGIPIDGPFDPALDGLGADQHVKGCIGTKGIVAEVLADDVSKVALARTSVQLRIESVLEVDKKDGRTKCPARREQKTHGSQERDQCPTERRRLTRHGLYDIP